MRCGYFYLSINYTSCKKERKYIMPAKYSWEVFPYPKSMFIYHLIYLLEKACWPIELQKKITKAIHICCRGVKMRRVWPSFSQSTTCIFRTWLWSDLTRSTPKVSPKILGNIILHAFYMQYPFKCQSLFQVLHIQVLLKG